jgi:hypothetical protein
MLDSEKYDPHSPKQVEDIVGNNATWTNLYKLIRENTASHTVLVGPPGCGKSLFFRLALVGYPQLIIDCTANSGLRDVRESIRLFARGSKLNDGKHRWIVFERADALTADTQAFLRRMFQTTSGSIRKATTTCKLAFKLCNSAKNSSDFKLVGCSKRRFFSIA